VTWEGVGFRFGFRDGEMYVCKLVNSRGGWVRGEGVGSGFISMRFVIFCLRHAGEGVRG
jgi:hypothetical protein